MVLQANNKHKVSSSLLRMSSVFATQVLQITELVQSLPTGSFL